MRTFTLCQAVVLMLAATASAQTPEMLSLANVPAAPSRSANEPMRGDFSAKAAARYLDIASLNWQKSQDCATCHTNMAYMMARPALREEHKDSGEVRSFFEQYYLKRWDRGNKSPRNAYHPVVVANALAFNDFQTAGTLSDTARKTLDVMWTQQRDDGSWNWLKCGWAPMEIDDHYGVTLALLAAGLFQDYAETPQAKTGIQKAKLYLQANPPPSLHHRMMIAWASNRVDGLMDETAKAKLRKDVFAKQLDDGGWSTSSLLADWKSFKRLDGKPHDVNTSDAYATGLAIVISRELGLPESDDRLQNGISWIKSNQRESGMWFTRSPSMDSSHYFTNFGSAFAVLALQSCGELPGWPFADER